ncbi:class I SAM-dependent methyltransferase [Thermodesulfobacteriota bacterium]
MNRSLDKMSPECPLCKSKRNIELEKISCKDLSGMYADFLGQQIDYLFGSRDHITKNCCEQCHLIFFDPTIAGDEKFYSLISEKKFYYPAQKDEYEYSLRFISEKEKVLDIGCGAGEYGSMVNNYTGIEINESAVRTAQKKDLRVLRETIEEHSAKYPETYDVICAFQVLEHIVDPHAFLRDMVKGLKKGGRIILSVPSADSFIAYSQNHLLNLPPHHLTWWSDLTIDALAQLFPLELIEIYHEPVQEIHLNSYVITLYTQMLNALLPFTYYTIRVHPGLAERIRNKIAVMLCNKTLGLFKSPRFRPIGHTVTAVFRLKSFDASKS